MTEASYMAAMDFFPESRQKLAIWPARASSGELNGHVATPANAALASSATRGMIAPPPARRVTSRVVLRHGRILRLASTARLAPRVEVERLAVTSRLVRGRHGRDLFVREVPRRTLRGCITRVMLAKERSHERLAELLGVALACKLRGERVRRHGRCHSCHLLRCVRWDGRRDASASVTRVRAITLARAVVGGVVVARHVTYLITWASRCQAPRVTSRHVARHDNTTAVVCSRNRQHPIRVVNSGNPPAPLGCPRRNREKVRLSPGLQAKNSLLRIRVMSTVSATGEN